MWYRSSSQAGAPSSCDGCRRYAFRIRTLTGKFVAVNRSPVTERKDGPCEALGLIDSTSNRSCCVVGGCTCAVTITTDATMATVMYFTIFPLAEQESDSNWHQGRGGYQQQGDA